MVSNEGTSNMIVLRALTYIAEITVLQNPMVDFTYDQRWVIHRTVSAGGYYREAVMDRAVQIVRLPLLFPAC